MAGKVLGGRYTVQDKIGTGGMAIVYRGIDEVLGRTVAIKTMLPQYAADPSFAARFKQDKAEADAGKLDDEGLKKWYDENSKSLELPERTKLRLVKFDAAASNALAAVTVTEDALRDHYDVTVDKYTTTDTNGVETVKKFEDVRAEVEKEVRLIESVQCLVTNLTSRVYGVKPAEGKSRLDEIAAESGLKVETSDWFSLEGPYKDGFMKRATAICPGAQSSRS